MTAARFPALRQGYESFYLRACHPDGGLGIWIRYTVNISDALAGSLWFTLFEESGPTARKLTLPDPEPANWLRIGDAHIGPGHATGRIDAVSWNLTFQGESPLRHLTQPWLYRSPIPRAKPESLHPSAHVHGTITLDDRELVLDGWPGMVGHNWGTQHADRWIWLHGLGFGGWLDVVLARIRIAGRQTPWLAAGALSLDGQRFPLATHRLPRVDETPDQVRFSLPGKDITVAGTISAPRHRFVGWQYGTHHHTLNCSIADLDLTAVGRHLTASGLAAYELGTREHDLGVPLQPYPD
jgi:hypothetical protein